MRSLLVIIVALLASTCTQAPSLLQQIKATGELRVVTRNSATTFYTGPDGEPTGLEYDLAKRFADFLGVELKMYAPGSFNEVLPAVAKGKAAFAAAGLSITPDRREKFRFTPPYDHVIPQLVYRAGDERPSDPTELGGELVVIAGSSHAELLQQLKTKYPALDWRVDKDAGSVDLLVQVAQGEIDYTIADSNEVAIQQRYYPELRVAFDLPATDALAWAFLRSDDDSVYQAAVAFMERLRSRDKLAQLRDRYYGHTDQLNYVGTRIFTGHIASRLPTYRPLFKKAANQFNVDWRLLAAIGYQESHWNPQAVSPTGVRGMMMLTKVTAHALGVENRINPKQSIFGGAEYIAWLHSRIPEDIPEPDRTWMALAAYNVGFSHLEDARVITEIRGGDPDRWVDVRESLPLLSQRKWYSRTSHGYARGMEPVIYVENIRSYYDILVWTSSQEPEPKPTAPLPSGLTET